MEAETKITEAINNLPGIFDVAVNVEKSTVSTTIDNELLPEQAVGEAIESAGYSAEKA